MNSHNTFRNSDLGYWEVIIKPYARNLCKEESWNCEVYHIIKNKLISKTWLYPVIKYIQTGPLSYSTILLGT